MSLEGTDRFQSPYEEMKREPGRINIALFPGPKTPPEKYIYCPVCHRNLVKYDDSGNNTLICPTCGHKHELKPVAAAAQEGLKQKLFLHTEQVRR